MDVVELLTDILTDADQLDVTSVGMRSFARLSQQQTFDILRYLKIPVRKNEHCRLRADLSRFVGIHELPDHTEAVFEDFTIPLVLLKTLADRLPPKPVHQDSVDL